MIRVTKMEAIGRAGVRTSHETVDGALEAFDATACFMVVRLETDEELVAFDNALAGNNRRRLQFATGPSFIHKTLTLTPDGEGWRMLIRLENMVPSGPAPQAAPGGGGRH